MRHDSDELIFALDDGKNKYVNLGRRSQMRQRLLRISQDHSRVHFEESNAAYSFRLGTPEQTICLLEGDSLSVPFSY